MKLRIFVSLLVAIVFGCIPILVLWLSGNELVRSESLAGSFVMSIVMFIASFAMAISCPLWSQE
jgi:hypothetical protein